MDAAINLVVNEIRSPQQRWEFVLDKRTWERASPMELYLYVPQCWVRADGSQVRYGQRNGFAVIRPGFIDRWRIRRAVRKAAELF